MKKGMVFYDMVNNKENVSILTEIKDYLMIMSKKFLNKNIKEIWNIIHNTKIKFLLKIGTLSL